MYNKWHIIEWKEVDKIIEVDRSQEMAVDRDWVKIHLLAHTEMNLPHISIKIHKVQPTTKIKDQIFILNSLWNQLFRNQFKEVWIILRLINIASLINIAIIQIMETIIIIIITNIQIINPLINLNKDKINIIKINKIII
jgi:hypothetical protein